MNPELVGALLLIMFIVVPFIVIMIYRAGGADAVNDTYARSDGDDSEEYW